MAPRAVGDRSNAELRAELAADLDLRSRRLPLHVRDAIERPEVLLRLTVTIEAEPHGQRLRLIDLAHVVDAAMTGHAADSLVHVDRVIEEDEVGERVDAVPAEWPVLEIAAADGRELG